MDLNGIVADLIGYIVAAIFGPPVVAFALSRIAQTKEWIARPPVAAAFIAVSVSTITSLLIWLTLPARPDAQRTVLKYADFFPYELVIAGPELVFSLDQSRFGVGCGSKPPVPLVNVTGSGYHNLTFLAHVSHSPVNGQWKGSILTNQAKSIDVKHKYDLHVYLLASCE